MSIFEDWLSELPPSVGNDMAYGELYVRALCMRVLKAASEQAEKTFQELGECYNPIPTNKGWTIAQDIMRIDV